MLSSNNTLDKGTKTNKNKDPKVFYQILLVWIIALNLLAFSYYMFFYHGSYQYLGEFLGYPLYRFSPFPAMVIPSLLLLGLSFTVYFVAELFRKHIRLLLLILVAFIFISYILIVFTYTSEIRFVTRFNGEKTDSYIIQYAAAKAIIEGTNPYKLSFLDTLTRSMDSGIMIRPTYIYDSNSTFFNGTDVVGFVDKFDYPAMAALYYVPAVILGIPGVYWDAFVLGLALALVYMKTDKSMRPLILALYASGTFSFFGPLYIGNPQAGWVAPLMIALVYANNPMISGILLGAASSYREMAVIFTIFFVIYLAKEHDKSALYKFMLSYVLTGIILNMPFFLSDPELFIHNILMPLSYNLYPEGFGLSSLYYIDITISKQLLLALFLASNIFLIILSYTHYEKLKPYLFALPSIGFLFYYRPMITYYEYFLVLNAMYLAMNLKLGEYSSQHVRIQNTLISRLMILAVILSSILLYYGSPRELEWPYQTSLHPGVILTTIMGLYVVVLFFIYRNEKTTIYNEKPKKHEKARTIISFIILSLIIAVLVQQLLPAVKVQTYTPYYIDTESAISGLSGVSISSFQNPYKNYNSSLITMLEEGRIGAYYTLSDYNRSVIYSPNSSLQLYGRLKHSGSLLTLVTEKTGVIFGDILFTYIVNNSIIVKGLAYSILLVGQLLLITSVYYLYDNETKKLYSLLLLTTVSIPIFLYTYSAPSFAYFTGLILITVSLALVRKYCILCNILMGVLFVLSPLTFAGTIAILAALRKLPQELSPRQVLVSIISITGISFLLGGSNVFKLFDCIIERGLSLYIVLSTNGILNNYLQLLKLVIPLTTILVTLSLFKRQNILLGIFLGMLTVFLLLPLWRVEHIVFSIALYFMVASIGKMMCHETRANRSRGEIKEI